MAFGNLLSRNPQDTGFKMKYSNYKPVNSLQQFWAAYVDDNRTDLLYKSFVNFIEMTYLKDQKLSIYCKILMTANVTVFFHIQAVEYFIPSFLFCSCLEGISL